MPEYLTTKELAELLRIKERKVYDLAASGQIPCARVTGKLLFPARDIDAWLAAGREGPIVAPPRPPVVLGSHDPLLEWALRESRCGLATYFDGSLDGVARLIEGRGVAAGVHLRDPDGGWNRTVAQGAATAGVALIGFARRARGLLVAPQSGVASLLDLPGRRFAARQPESGAQALFLDLLAEAGIDAGAIETVATARTESEAALAVADGRAEACFGLAALAAPHRLRFVPILEEQFDLLVERRAWFEAPMQGFLAFCRTSDFMRRAAEMGGYDVSDLGAVRWNGD